MVRWDEIKEDLGAAIYSDMVSSIGCGPFDGGCLLMARAMARAMGGEVMVLVDAEDRAQHAVAMKDGMLLDFDGWSAPVGMLRRFNEAEHACCISWRSIGHGDLEEAAVDAALEDRIFEALRSTAEALPAPRSAF